MADRDIHKVNLYASDEAISAAWAEMARRRICTRCGEYFTTFSALGNRQCNQHPKPTKIEPHPTRGRQEMYACCGKKIPLPNYCRAAGIVPNAAVMDLFTTSSCMMPEFTPQHPIGCVQADHTDREDRWPSGVVNIVKVEGKECTEEDVCIDLLRPVGGWPIGAKVRHNNNVCEVRSPPDAFGMIRLSTGEEAIHIKELRPTEKWKFENVGKFIRENEDEEEKLHTPAERENTTLEIMNPTDGREADNISFVGNAWRPWKHGIRIADIAGVIPYMLNDDRKHIYGEKSFNDRPGVSDKVPVIWRINVPNTT